MRRWWMLGLVAMVWAGTGAAPVQAAVKGEVVAASNATTGRLVVFSALDGGQRRELTCGGNLSNTFPDGARYWAYAREAAPARSSLYAIDEDCTVGREVVLSDTSLDVEPWTVSWSPSGNRIAFYATQRNLLGNVVAEGLFVGTVQRDLAGRPQSLLGSRFAFAMQPTTVSWSGDEQRVTFGQELSSIGYATGTQSDVFLGNVDTGTLANLTGTDVGEFQPAFSPVDDAIAYVTRTPGSGHYRNDIFVLNPTTGVTSQLTNKSNAGSSQIGHPSYSPDGRSIAFSGWPSSKGANIYRLAANGSGRAVDLTSSSPDIHYTPQWRR